MNEFLEQFLLESQELVQQASDDLLALEQDPVNKPRLDSAFRAFHTLKGAAGIMDFAPMARLTHAAEDVLAAARSGATPLTSNLVSQSLSCLDRISEWLTQIEAADELPADAEEGVDALINRLHAAAVSGAAKTVAPAIKAATQPCIGPGILPEYAIEVLQAQVALISLPEDAAFFGRLSSGGRVCRNILAHFGLTQEAADIDAALALLQLGLSPNIASAPADTTPATQSVPPRVSPPEPEYAPATSARSLRIDVERIEAIINVTGELIIAKNALGYAANAWGRADDPKKLAAELQLLHAQFSRLTAELLRHALATRVLPLARVFQRFPRLVREMAARLDKPIRLVIEGDATEADKVVVEALFEPLLHVLRNAIDHGVESRPERLIAAKPETAVIILSARREGDRVIVEVEDDGSGIDIDAIRAKAIERHLVTAEVLAEMQRAEIQELIFLPGLSTAGGLTDISGRGVGMDAVRAGIERLGGSVNLESRTAIGTRVRFILPFSVMLTRVLTLYSGGQIFAVPFDSVVQTVQLPREEITTIGSVKAFALFGKTIPLIKLAEALDLPQPEADKPLINAAIMLTRGGEFGALQVDSFGGQLDIILKPIDGLLRGTPGIAGTTLLGDGTVLIVLELQELLK